MEQAQGLTPRARAKRDQIRGGARRWCLRRGVAGASTDAIVAEAGVSKQTLYAYYPNKETLLASVLGHLIGEGSGRQLPAVEGTSRGTPEEVRRSLGSLAHGLIASLMQPDYLALMRVVIAETPRLPRLGSLFKSAVPEQVLGNVSEILRIARAEGVVGEVDPDSASRMFAGALLTYAILDGLLVG